MQPCFLNKGEYEIMVILAIDPGGVRTGIAVCDAGERLAFPVCVIEERSRKKLAERIREIALERRAEEIVLGYPRNMDGSEGESARNSNELAERLREATRLPVVLRDERGTSITAHGYLNNTDTRGKKRKAVVDAVAATIILQDDLDYRRNIAEGTD